MDALDCETAGKFSELEFFPCIPKGLLFEITECNSKMWTEWVIPVVGIEQVQPGPEAMRERLLH